MSSTATRPVRSVSVRVCNAWKQREREICIHTKTYIYITVRVQDLFGTVSIIHNGTRQEATPSQTPKAAQTCREVKVAPQPREPDQPPRQQKSAYADFAPLTNQGERFTPHKPGHDVQARDARRETLAKTQRSPKDHPTRTRKEIHRRYHAGRRRLTCAIRTQQTPIARTSFVASATPTGSTAATTLSPSRAGLFEYASPAACVAASQTFCSTDQFPV